MDDFPYLYRNSLAEAGRLGETERWWDSFHNNAACARYIEAAIRGSFDEAAEQLKPGCAESVLAVWGFRRVNMVLANTLRDVPSHLRHLYSGENLDWGGKAWLPPDTAYRRYYVVQSGATLTDSFVTQAREAYQALGLFGPEHCEEDSRKQDFTGKVLVLRPDVMKESCWSPQNCLWKADTGFGCSPTAMGRAVYATCLGDGEQARWDRADFTGVLKDEFLPDWAREKLEELQAQKQSGPAMGGMA